MSPILFNCTCAGLSDHGTIASNIPVLKSLLSAQCKPTGNPLHITVNSYQTRQSLHQGVTRRNLNELTQLAQKSNSYTLWFSTKVSAPKIESLQMPNQSFTCPNQILPGLSEQTGTPCAQLQLQSSCYQRIPL